jgi:DNA-binding transcriptional regulator YiaG
MNTPHHHEWNHFNKMFQTFRRETKGFKDSDKLALLIEKNPSSLKLLGIVLGYPIFRFSELCGFDRDTFYRFSSGRYIPSKKSLLKISKVFIEELSEWYIPSEFTLKYRFFYWIKNKNKSDFFTPSAPTSKDLIKAYNELEVATNNFELVNQRSIQAVPRSTLVIRSLLGISQLDFARLLNISCKSAQDWEYCAVMPRKDAGLVAKEFSNLLSDMKKEGGLSVKHAIENYEIFRDPAKLWAKNFTIKDMQNRSLKMLKLSRRSNQEKKIKNVLIERGLDFIEQYPIISPEDLGGDVSMIVSDFALPSNEPKIIIEASGFPNIRGVITLAWKAYRLSKYRPNIIKICCINKIKCSRIKHEKGIKILSEAYDYVVENNDFNRLTDIISDNIGNNLKVESCSSS